ncbi:hypothetical protein QQ020_34055 [Fulvivirgaceae bacterium BMA12]|uniref:Uncharacterized protein n=1 Tax=Agaribacillus aureus TaxID=3051825 RepID=A0ABT8LL35_9BACT|nr:hypothetical protein [Fulvivirgaceae bacterium BMA12]
MHQNLNFKTDIVPFLIATIGEFIALHYWLTYMDLGNLLLANLLLWVGFGIERGSVAVWVKKVYRPKEGITGTNVPVWQQILGWGFITFTEILIWIVWYYSIDRLGYMGSTAILYGLMLIQHSAELGLVKRKNIFSHTLDLKTHFFTLMEVLGAVGWIYYHQQGDNHWAMLCLLIGLSIEHIIEGSSLKPENVERVSPPPSVP